MPLVSVKEETAPPAGLSDKPSRGVPGAAGHVAGCSVWARRGASR